MIDLFSIIEAGGTILWQAEFIPLPSRPLDALVRRVLLAERAAAAAFTVGPTTLRWALAARLGLVFVVAYPTRLPPAYKDALLTAVRDAFVRAYGDALAAPGADVDILDVSGFDAVFRRLHAEAEAAVAAGGPGGNGVAGGPAPYAGGKGAKKKRGKAARKKGGGGGLPSDGEQPPPPSTPAAAPVASKEEAAVADDGNAEEEEDPMARLARARAAFLRKRGGGGRPSAAAAATAAAAARGAAAAAAPRKREKKLRAGSRSAPTQADIDALDMSAGKDERRGGDADAEAVARVRQQFVDAAPNRAFDYLDEEEGDAGAGRPQAVVAAPGGGGTGWTGGVSMAATDAVAPQSAAAGVVSFFRGLAGVQQLTAAELAPALAAVRDALIAKNVTADIAERLCASVGASLDGVTMASMTTITATVRGALRDALTRLLTPRQSTDILADIAAKRAAGGGPFVIVYCGVNGVGKSTSLAKTAFYLQRHGLTVLLAACDTFRAGAVEQLRTHATCLGVTLYDRGYGRDAAGVASDAIRRAREAGTDVVLVDTAGRMQDNGPLMAALAKLVAVNDPDRVFFVGEALVGNDGVDQLTKFNAALADHQAGSGRVRLVDGVVLTKFDTVDDRVGAAVSMVYATGVPVVFVGVGQTYMDLRTMNTGALVKALLR